MTASRRLRRVLATCVASNALFAAAGLVALDGAAPAAHVLVAKGAPAQAGTDVTSPTTSLTPSSPAADTSSAQSNSQAPRASRSPSSHTSSSTGTSTTRPAAAVDDVTGIASSAAPPTVTRDAPDAGDYPATFTGSATVNGRGQSFPSSGDVVFTKTGSDLRQSSPNTPGDVKITQRFSPAEAALVSFQLKASDTTKYFTPASPVTFIPYLAAQGTAWSWGADSDDGATHIRASGSVGGSQTMAVGGETVTLTEITTTLSISGDINGTATLTLWVSPTHRLPVVQHQVINATASSGYGFSNRFNSDVTQTLTRLTPA